jgi:DNA-binding NarL/FixJ family response regulator
MLKREYGAHLVAKAGLTQREVEIVQAVATGMRNKGIAKKLHVTEGTVKVHLHNIYEKLGVSGRLELVLTAQEKGLV